MSKILLLTVNWTELQLMDAEELAYCPHYEKVLDYGSVKVFKVEEHEETLVDAQIESDRWESLPGVLSNLVIHRSRPSETTEFKHQWR